MKKLIFIFFPVLCYGQDSTEIRQEIFPSLGKFALLTTNGELYDNVVHGTLEFVEAQKVVEMERALRKRRPIAIIKAKCFQNSL